MKNIFKYIFKGYRVLGPTGPLKDILPAIDGEGKIRFLIEADLPQYLKQALKDDLAKELEVIEGKGYIMPGFIDLHIHGAAGSDTMDASPEALATISQSLCKSGVTGYLPTTMTMPWPDIEAALNNVREYRLKIKNLKEKGEQKPLGATVHGVHMEGPFISPEYKGAQPPEHIIPPDAEKIRPFLDVVRLISMAPECDENFAFIKEMKDKLIISLGHSATDYECAAAAFEAGATHITHCFNAMTGLHHRRPGLVGAALALPFKTEFITDKIHIRPELFAPIMATKDPDDIILVTDAMRAAFLPDGMYELGGNPVQLKDGACTLPDGTIAGSAHRLDAALKNMREYTNYPLWRISRMLSHNPAAELGILAEKGSIEEGKDADLVITDEELNILSVYVEGVKQF